MNTVLLLARLDMGLPPDLQKRAMACLPPEKRGRIERFHRREDTLRSLVGDIMARYALCRAAAGDASGGPPVIAPDRFGKPQVASPRGLHFNVAHAGGWVVCAVSERAVGVDVERIEAPLDLAVARRFFARSEYEQLCQADAADRLRLFYRFWTLKESYIKAIGAGMRLPLNSFAFSLDGERIALRAGRFRGDYHFTSHYPDECHVVGLCRLGEGAVAVEYGGQNEIVAAYLDRYSDRNSLA